MNYLICDQGLNCFVRKLYDVKVSVKDKEFCFSIEISFGICCVEILFVIYIDIIFIVFLDKRNLFLEMFVLGLSVVLILCFSYVISIWICLFIVNIEGFVVYSFCWVIVVQVFGVNGSVIQRWSYWVIERLLFY